MGCEGLHCGGCRSGGSSGGGSGRAAGAVVVLIILVVVIICGVAAHQQIEQTADTVGHVVVIAVEVVLGILIAAATGLAGYGAVRIGMRIHAYSAARPRLIQMQALAEPGQALGSGAALQIEPVHRITGLDDAVIPEAAAHRQKNF
jgi:hypothetical protein